MDDSLDLKVQRNCSPLQSSIYVRGSFHFISDTVRSAHHIHYQSLSSSQSHHGVNWERKDIKISDK